MTKPHADSSSTRAARRRSALMHERLVPPDSPDRRSVLQLMAASVALAGAGCTRVPDERIVPYERMPEAGTASLPVYYASAFVRSGFAHGVLVGTKQGRPIKIEGNPTHPASRGATDVFAQA